MNQITFDQNNIVEALSKISDDELNLIDFGITGLDNDFMVTRYNKYLVNLSGVSIQSAVGFHYFSNIAPCMNNFMVSQKLEDAIDEGTSIDETINYVLSVKMKPTKVKIRLVYNSDLMVSYVLILA